MVVELNQTMLELAHWWRKYDGFMEHVTAGNIFIAMAFYWIRITMVQMFNAQKKNEPFVSILWNVNSGKKCFSAYNVFFFLFILFLTIGPIVISINYFTMQVQYIIEFHHIAIYSTFYLHFIAVNFQSKNNVWGLLQGDYLTLAFGFFVHAIIIGFHFVEENSSSALHVMMHIMFLITIIMLTLFVTLEMIFRNSLLIAICRSYVTLIYGTWLYSIAFVLFPIIPNLPLWDMNSSFSKIMVVVLFVENIVIDFIIVLIYVHISFKRFRRFNIFDSRENSFESEKLL